MQMCTDQSKIVNKLLIRDQDETYEQITIQPNLEIGINDFSCLDGKELKIHKLKTWSEFFEAVYQRKKTAELRLNDRNFAVGDIMILQEYRPTNQEYTGREIKTKITHITKGISHLKENHVMLSFEIIVE